MSEREMAAREIRFQMAYAEETFANGEISLAEFKSWEARLEQEEAALA